MFNKINLSKCSFAQNIKIFKFKKRHFGSIILDDQVKLTLLFEDAFKMLLFKFPLILFLSTAWAGFLTLTCLIFDLINVILLCLIY